MQGPRKAAAALLRALPIADMLAERPAALIK
jgi:hypothetical protein